MQIFASSKTQEVVIHDLRTPLNVISLALRMLDTAALARSPELAEDLAMIRSNSTELEKMLSLLVDASRLPTGGESLDCEPTDIRRLIEEAVAEMAHKASMPPLELRFEGPSPLTVNLDPQKARMAFQKALMNASSASGGKPVEVLVGALDDAGAIVRISTSIPPRDTVVSHEIDPRDYQRILGTPGERRGIDLAVAASICQLFGGRARLEAEPGRGTTIVLEWPSRAAKS
jgi:signal transduction histidine kinase